MYNGIKVIAVIKITSGGDPFYTYKALQNSIIEEKIVEIMKGNKTIIHQLNSLLTDELTAINQYIVHSEICENWGYKKLHDTIKKRAIEEMKHAEKLIARILFLEGIPEVGSINKISIGDDIEKQFKCDKDAETAAVKQYNESIRMCVEKGDNGTSELLESILADEEKHLDWLEIQLEQIMQLHLKNYLLEQTN
jgi:bacterioferritin